MTSEIENEACEGLQSLIGRKLRHELALGDFEANSLPDRGRSQKPVERRYEPRVVDLFGLLVR